MYDCIVLGSYWSNYDLTSVCINNMINVSHRVRRINDDIIIRLANDNVDVVTFVLHGQKSDRVFFRPEN